MKTIRYDGVSIKPSKIVCIGRNYADHAKELGNEVPDEMVVFIKPNSAIDRQLYSFHQEPLHYEAEICLLLEQGKFCGVGFGLDLTKRTLQSQLKAKGLPWEKAKAFNGAAVFSDFVCLDQGYSELRIRLLVNNKLRQEGGVIDMLFPPNIILEQLGEFLCMEDGDIIMTGTPKGVGEVKQGDVFKGEILLANKVLISQSWVAQ